MRKMIKSTSAIIRSCFIDPKKPTTKCKRDRKKITIKKNPNIVSRPNILPAPGSEERRTNLEIKIKVGSRQPNQHLGD